MASTLEPDVQPSHPLSAGSDPRGGALGSSARVIGGIAALALAGVAGGLLWRSTERNKADRAERAFYEAQSAAAGNAAAAERALRPLTTRYAGTAGGAQAALLLAQALYDQGKYQDGLRVLDAAKLPAEFAAGGDLMRAAGLEGAGRPAEAARVYERLAGRTGVTPRRRDDLRASAARAYEAANDRPSARRLWQQIVDANASPLVDEARVRVGELGAG